MTTDTARLISSVGDQIVNLIAARDAHDQALEQCQVDWDYFGHHERVLLEKAEQGLAVALDEYFVDFLKRRAPDG